MIDKSILFQAKAFLCWEKFPNLSVKLIPIDQSVAFFYPPSRDISTINLFYQKNTIDFTQAVCLLFHETGHLSQWNNYKNQHRDQDFWQLLDVDKGDEKVKFEREAWDFGEPILNDFAAKSNLVSSELNKHYKKLTEESILTYTC